MEYGKFLETYRLYSSGNETPELIHIWVALSTLAGACERRLWIDMGYFKLFLNLYVIFVAPPGVCAKSTSMGMGLDLLKRAGYFTLEDSVLKERIIEELCDAQKEAELPNGTKYIHSSITYVADELNVLLASGVDMVKFLVTIYSKKDVFQYRTKKSGIYEVQGPYFNLMAAAVPEWFAKELVGDMTATGFLARCIIVYEEDKRMKAPRLTLSTEQKRARVDLLEIITSIGAMAGEVTLAPEAGDFYDEWYYGQNIPRSEDFRMRAYLERRTKVHVLKVAALLAISDLRLVITVADIKRALNIFRVTEKKMRIVYAMSGGNKLANHMVRVLALLDDNMGRMALRDLVKAFFYELDHESFKGVIQMLEAMEAVQRVKIGNTTFIERSHAGDEL